MVGAGMPTIPIHRSLSALAFAFVILAGCGGPLGRDGIPAKDDGGEPSEDGADSHLVGSIVGLVLDEEYRSVSDATVTLNPARQQPAKTRMDGSFGLRDVPAGSYVLTASKPPLRPETATLMVHADESVSVILILRAIAAEAHPRTETAQSAMGCAVQTGVDHEGTGTACGSLFGPTTTSELLVWPRVSHIWRINADGEDIRGLLWEAQWRDSTPGRSAWEVCLAVRPANTDPNPCESRDATFVAYKHPVSSPGRLFLEPGVAHPEWGDVCSAEPGGAAHCTSWAHEPQRMRHDLVYVGLNSTADAAWPTVWRALCKGGCADYARPGLVYGARFEFAMTQFVGPRSAQSEDWSFFSESGRISGWT